MLRAYVPSNGSLKVVEVPAGDLPPPEATWIDLYKPTREEEQTVERALGLEVPTREEMQEIEISSRLYEHNGNLYMTASVVMNADSDQPEVTAVTFILVGRRLATIRYGEPRAFRTFPLHAARMPGVCQTGETTLLGLLDTIIDRAADVLERVGAESDALSREIFGPGSGGKPTRASSDDLREALRDLGRHHDLTSKTRESLVSIGRLLTFLAQPGTERSKDFRNRVKSLARDAHSLTEHTAFLSNNLTFLLDAMLGLINVEQNSIIKIFSVAAVVFLPPTLIASIYGMNFQWMPELGWKAGYPFAIVLMIISAILPYAYFKRRGWL
ncbi:MAG: magnesium/cobalt transporter CorA [Rhodospirillaceae bacterium]|nr:magnesium/cobalt transporter CorA [Rhodospirillaceae bacterium]